MTRSELTTGHRWAMAGLAVSACVMLGACGTSGGDTPGETTQSSSAIPAATQKFCSEAQSAMASLSGKDPTSSMSLDQARAALDSLLSAGIKSFSGLQGKAPASLRSSIRIIVADFRSYEAEANKATSTRELLASSVKANPVQKSAYQELLSYLSDTCQ